MNKLENKQTISRLKNFYRCGDAVFAVRAVGTFCIS